MHILKSSLRVILLVILGCFLSGCIKTPLDQKDQIIAKVNGEPVLLKEFLLNFNQIKSEQDEASQKNPKLVEQWKLRALNEVIIITLLRQESAKRKLKITKEEVEGRLANWKDGYPPGGFEEMLKKQNTNETYLKRRIEDQLLIEKITEDFFTSETRVSDEETTVYFKQHQGEFIQPEKVHAFQIVVPTREEAEKIKQEISSGKTTFESAARQYSLSPDSAKGGDLGFFAMNEKIAAFNEAFALGIGHLSKPISSKYGVHILKVVEKKPQKKLTYSEAKDDIVKILKRSKEVKIYKEWATKLLKDGEIVRNESLFNSST